MRTIVIIDGQGGGCGRGLVEKLCQRRPADCRILAIGTNSAATAAMVKAGADAAATGENPVLVNCPDAAIIAGPMGIVLANALLGEITPTMAQAVATSGAHRVLIPMTRCGTQIVGVEERPLGQYLEEAVDRICRLLEADG